MYGISKIEKLIQNSEFGYNLSLPKIGKLSSRLSHEINHCHSK